MQSASPLKTTRPLCFAFRLCFIQHVHFRCLTALFHPDILEVDKQELQILPEEVCVWISAAPDEADHKEVTEKGSYGKANWNYHQGSFEDDQSYPGL